MNKDKETATRMREVCQELRTRSIPLSDMIPMMQKSADLLDGRRVFLMETKDLTDGDARWLSHGWTSNINTALEWSRGGGREERRMFHEPKEIQ